MIAQEMLVGRKGRLWSLAKVPWTDAEAEDFRFWHDGLSPEQRVEAVTEALDECLKTRGVHGALRLRRVHRRVKRTGSKVPDRRRTRSRLPRSVSRHQSP